MPSYQPHVWELEIAPHDNEEYRRWTRTCRACGDRVSAFRATAIYQHGDDAERLPHAVPLSTWHLYAGCIAPAPAAAVAEGAPAYDRNDQTTIAMLERSPTAEITRDILQRLHDAHGWTWSRLAEELGATRDMVYKWRTFAAAPSNKYALRIARAALTSHNPRVIRPLLRPDSDDDAPLLRRAA